MSDEQETQPTAPAESSPEELQDHPQEAPETPATAPDEPAASLTEEAPEGRFVSVDEAAEHLGLSARTVRRRINAGELTARRAEHSHAWLVWIEGLPAESEEVGSQNATASEAKETAEEQPAEQGRKGEGGAASETALVTLPITTETIHALTDLVADLTARNEALSMELGASRERIRQLEGQLQALPVGEVPAAAKPWWKRMFGIE